MPAVTISVRDLTKRFHHAAGEVVAVDDVSFEVTAGQMVAISGPSGSGKSTLLHLIGGIEQADSGSVVVGDVEVTALRRAKLTAYRRTVGFVFQRYHLLAALTVLDNVIAPVLPHRVDFPKPARARELLDAVGLSGREHDLPAQLSGGQQQRVALARALMGRPNLLLADEPTGNLDSHTSIEVLGLLTRLRELYGITVLVATHDPAVTAHCQRLLRLGDGRIVEDLALSGGDPPEATLARATRPGPL